MGIRVHKFAGYGFTDMQPNVDPRVNWKCGLLNWDHHGLSGDDYFHWLGDQRRILETRVFSMDYLMLRTEAKLRSATLLDCLAWDTEYGLKNVMALRPLAYPDWGREDDTIDYVTEIHLSGGQRARVEEIPTGIFPFDGRYMDARTGEQLPHEVIWFVRLKNELGIEYMRAVTDGQVSALDEAAKAHTPFDSAVEAAGHIVPLVPEEIRDICEFSGLLTEPNGWKDMRPLLYTWWG